MTSKTISQGEVTVEVSNPTLQSRMIEAALNVRLGEGLSETGAFIDRITRGTFVHAMAVSRTHGLGALDVISPDAAFTSDEVAAAYTVFKEIDAALWDKWDKTIAELRAPITPVSMQPDAAKKKSLPRKTS